MGAFLDSPFREYSHSAPQLSPGRLAFARNRGIPAYHLSSSTHPDPEKLDLAICEALRTHGANLALLVGYNKLLGLGYRYRPVGLSTARWLSIRRSCQP